MQKYPYVLVLALVASTSFADSERTGYVLKSADAEYAAGALIMASPSTGTNGGVMMQEGFAENFSTGLHYHVTADEFFYVLEGSGHVQLGLEVHPVTVGDVIFVPSGQEHKMFTDGKTMKVLVFLDKPGLADEFRAWHREFGNAVPQSLEQLNGIARKYGTVYKTIQ